MHRWLVIVVLAFLLPGYGAAVGSQTQADVLDWSADGPWLTAAEAVADAGDPSPGQDGSDELVPEDASAEALRTAFKVQGVVLPAWAPPFIEGAMRPPTGA